MADLRAASSYPRAAAPIAAGIAVLFGVATILSGGGALFGGESARAAVGNAVGFVLWFNFLAGFAYVAAGLAIAFRHRRAAQFAMAIAAATIVVFAAFGVHVLLGGLYEVRTVGAMTLRSVLWIAIAWAVARADRSPR